MFTRYKKKQISQIKRCKLACYMILKKLDTSQFELNANHFLYFGYNKSKKKTKEGMEWVSFQNFNYLWDNNEQLQEYLIEKQNQGLHLAVEETLRKIKQQNLTQEYLQKYEKKLNQQIQKHENTGNINSLNYEVLLYQKLVYLKANGKQGQFFQYDKQYKQKVEKIDHSLVYDQAVLNTIKQISNQKIETCKNNGNQESLQRMIAYRNNFLSLKSLMGQKSTDEQIQEFMSNPQKTISLSEMTRQKIQETYEMATNLLQESQQSFAILRFRQLQYILTERKQLGWDKYSCSVFVKLANMYQARKNKQKTCEYIMKSIDGENQMPSLFPKQLVENWLILVNEYTDTDGPQQAVKFLEQAKILIQKDLNHLKTELFSRITENLSTRYLDLQNFQKSVQNFKHFLKSVEEIYGRKSQRYIKTLKYIIIKLLPVKQHFHVITFIKMLLEVIPEYYATSSNQTQIIVEELEALKVMTDMYYLCGQFDKSREYCIEFLSKADTYYEINYKIPLLNEPKQEKKQEKQSIVGMSNKQRNQILKNSIVHVCDKVFGIYRDNLKDMVRAENYCRKLIQWIKRIHGENCKCALLYTVLVTLANLPTIKGKPFQYMGLNEELISLTPFLKQVPIANTITAYIELIKSAIDTVNFLKAQQYFQTVTLIIRSNNLTQSNAYAECLCLRGIILFLQKQYEKAKLFLLESLAVQQLMALNEAKGKQIKYPQILLALGNIYNDFGSAKKKQEDAEQMRYRRQSSQLFQKSLDCYQRFLNSKPSHNINLQVSGLFYLCRTYFQLQRTQRFIEYADKFLSKFQQFKLSQQYTNSQKNKVKIYLRFDTQQIDESLKGEIYSFLTAIYQSQGKFCDGKKAIQYCKKAVEILSDPKYQKHPLYHMNNLMLQKLLEKYGKQNEVQQTGKIQQKKTSQS